MNVLSLFAGIGGLDLGLERAGMTTVGQVEIDSFCRSVLAKHWPEVPRHDDVRSCVDWWWSEPRPPVHVVAGGFPCQPFSVRGQRRGVADERWGWPWMFGVVRALRPGYVVVENVADLVRDRDAFGWLLGDLASIGYDAEWDCIPAAAVGANHRRDRLFLVANARGERRGEGPRQFGGLGPAQRGPQLAHTNSQRRGQWTGPSGDNRGWPEPAHSGWWGVEPDVGRTLDGFSAWLDRSGRLDQSHKLILAYANAEDGDPAETLRTLRDAHGTRRGEWTTGGCGSVPSSAVLLAYLRQLEAHCWQAGQPLACATAPEVGVRSVRVDEVLARPPLRREPGEQRSGQPANSLHALSQLLARTAEQAWSAYRRSDAGATGWGWEDGYDRVAHGIPARVDRLRALGNAVVPQVAEYIGRLIVAADGLVTA